jgi:predicted nuclease of restriction endonuclease-like (RecB) superfamily
MELKNNTEYINWIKNLKATLHTARIQAVLAINATVIEFYWELGKMIAEKQTAWGTKFLEQLSKDLMEEFPEMKGLSVRNLKYCRQFYQFYYLEIGQQDVAQIRQHAVAQIPWGHNILIFSKAND